MTLSVCLIVKDEEQALARCLSRLSFADEIIITDTGSVDDTAEIASRFTNKIYNFKWCDDFAAARNFCFSKAGCDYVMWLDADDVITEQNAKKIEELKNEDFDAAFLKYASSGQGGFYFYRERIVRRENNFKWVGAVHEYLEVSGKIITSDATVLHDKIKAGDPARNLKIYEKALAAGRTLEGRELYYYGRELFYNGYYKECVETLEKFIGGTGWIRNKIEARRIIFRALDAEGRGQEALESLTKNFFLAPPESEDCCLVAGYCERVQNFPLAKSWYEAALKAQNPEEGFVNADYALYYPAIRLAVVCDKLGKRRLAKKYNELAGTAKPNDGYYLANREYFNKEK